MGSFSMRCFARMAFAPSSVVPSGAVMRFSWVITLRMGWSKLVSNRRSRLVSMPTSLPSSVMGTPEMRNLLISAWASATVFSGERKKGSMMTPFSERFTLSTWLACSSIVMFL